MKYIGIIVLAIVGIIPALWLMNPAPETTSRRLLPADVALSGHASELQDRVDITRYWLTLTVDPDRKFISGQNQIDFTALQSVDQFELDLDHILSIDWIKWQDRDLTYTRRGGKIIINLGHEVPAGTASQLTVAYSGHPHIALRAPWDGGFVWSKTPSGAPWAATAVQGNGCDLWWPCKDALNDKPDRVWMDITVPRGLVVATNGVLTGVVDKGDWQRYQWRLERPISAYNIALNIAPYETVEQVVPGASGSDIPLVFYALPEHIDKARTLVEADLLSQIAFFERRLGPFPFGDVKLGFAETPHLGMEHQTINAYGNQYKPDPYGFDWLLHHELSHEWFGNMMTQAAPRDFWLHEGFAMYMQPVYAEEVVGKAGYAHYMYRIHLGIENCNPMVPDDLPPGVDPGRHDVYNKGAWLLHTLRGFIGEEPFWRAVRRLLYGTSDPWSLDYPIEARHRTTEDFIALVSEEAGRDLGWFFRAYTKSAALPDLQYTHGPENSLTVWWQTQSDISFELPVDVLVNGALHRLDMTGGRSVLTGVRPDDRLQFDPEMKVLRRMPFSKTCGRAEG